MGGHFWQPEYNLQFVGSIFEERNGKSRCVGKCNIKSITSKEEKGTKEKSRVPIHTQPYLDSLLKVVKGTAVLELSPFTFHASALGGQFPTSCPLEEPD